MAAVIRLRQSHLNEMIAHAREEVPNECCGVVAARDGEVVKLYRARNADQSPLRFTIDPMETKRIEEQIDAEGLSLAGFYHSHVGSEARPSGTDIRAMAPFFGPPFVHFVVGLAERRRPVVRVFHIHPTRYDEQEYALVAD